jgi:hypothetical protein
MQRNASVYCWRGRREGGHAVVHGGVHEPERDSLVAHHALHTGREHRSENPRPWQATSDEEDGSHSWRQSGNQIAQTIAPKVTGHHSV